MNRLKRILRFLWRGIVFTFREVFTGLMLGISALLILIKLSPKGTVNVGYLIMFGLLAGLMKGISKFLFVELLNKVPAEEYTKNYPKYKMMFLWIAIFTLAAFVNFGFSFSLWLTEPARYIYESAILGETPLFIIQSGLWSIFMLGIISYIYEPSSRD